MSVTLFSIVESPSHPDFSELYSRLAIKEFKFGSIRKAIGGLKSQCPDIVVAEFYYGYGNNYAGVNISNLDVFLYSLQKYSTDARIIVMVEKHEKKFVDKLNEIYPLYQTLASPVSISQMEQALVP